MWLFCCMVVDLLCHDDSWGGVTKLSHCDTCWLIANVSCVITLIMLSLVFCSDYITCCRMRDKIIFSRKIWKICIRRFGYISTCGLYVFAMSISFLINYDFMWHAEFSMASKIYTSSSLDYPILGKCDNNDRGLTTLWDFLGGFMGV